VRREHSIIAFVALLLCGCESQRVAFEGNPMPEGQVTNFIKVLPSSPGYDTPPKFLRGYAPFYPPRYAASGFRGYTVLNFTVEPDGSTSNPRVVTTTAPDFAHEAINAIESWQFAPARKNGHPVRVRVQLPFTFNV
jgi:TonB family protein